MRHIRQHAQSHGNSVRATTERTFGEPCFSLVLTFFALMPCSTLLYSFDPLFTADAKISCMFRFTHISVRPHLSWMCSTLSAPKCFKNIIIDTMFAWAETGREKTRKTKKEAKEEGRRQREAETSRNKDKRQQKMRH